MNDLHVRVAGRTDRGRVRPNNEDAFVIADLDGTTLIGGDGSPRRVDVREHGVLLAVSDGIGGQRAGEVASAMSIESVTRALAMKSTEEPADSRLRDAVEKANRVVRAASARPDRERMGATLTAAYVLDGVAYLAEVGDSRAYLIRAGRIAQLTKDQTYVQVLVDAGLIEPRTADDSPFRNVILQSMGQEHDVKVALGKLELRRRDCLLLCSDGLTREATDDEIRECVLSSPSLEVACDALVGLANDRGGNDNVTVVVAGIGGSLPAPAATDDVDATYQILASFDAPLPPRTSSNPPRSSS
jgi:serine/threonine protein phosphatase PrpC